MLACYGDAFINDLVLEISDSTTFPLKISERRSYLVLFGKYNACCKNYLKKSENNSNHYIAKITKTIHKTTTYLSP